MANINTSEQAPDRWLHLALTEPTQTALSFMDGVDTCWRFFVIGRILGPVTLINDKGNDEVFSLQFLQNVSGQVIGQWTGVRGGSLCYDFHVGH